ncbi:MAG: hypothetical protein QOH08_833 [Chloroflexota bacterium]|nr:hypothetical protein [Chloroflexota bacterium]
MIRSLSGLLVAGALALGVTACGSVSPAAQGGASAAPQRNATEVALVSAVRPTIVATQELVRAGNFAAAKQAFVGYNAAWNGVEVYTNFRSRQLYGELETELETKVQAALGVAQPSAATLVPLLDQMLAKYDQVIRLSAEGPAISPLFDDVAAIRMTRASLRQVSPALKAGDLATAKAQYAIFQKDWANAEPLLHRSTDAFAEIGAAKSTADGAFKAERPAAELAPLVDALTERYNYGLNLVNVAARNADVTRTAFSAEDVTQVAALSAIEADLRASLPRWVAGDLSGAAASANRAKGERFDAVSATLKAKAADATLKTALDAFASLAAQAGDAAKTRAANKTAIEAVWTAQQALVGQFWSDPKLQAEIAKARNALGLPRI